jgi:hypothetical protein
VRLVNLSVEGAGLRLGEPLDDAAPSRGQKVTVEAAPIGRQQARVVWREGSDLGVAFARTT